MARAPQLHPIMRWIYILAIPGGILVTLAGKDPPLAHIHGWWAYPAGACLVCLCLATVHVLWIAMREDA